MRKQFTDDTCTVQELKKMVEKFGKERNWGRHHTPKNLSMNLAVEAAELMEHYVWEREGKPDEEEIADELADILFNVLNFAMTEKIDLSVAFMTKYKKLQKKYPTTKFNRVNDDLDEYRRIKKTYKANKK